MGDAVHAASCNGGYGNGPVAVAIAVTCAAAAAAIVVGATVTVVAVVAIDVGARTRAGARGGGFEGGEEVLGGRFAAHRGTEGGLGIRIGGGHVSSTERGLLVEYYDHRRSGRGVVGTTRETRDHIIISDLKSYHPSIQVTTFFFDTTSDLRAASYGRHQRRRAAVYRLLLSNL